MKTGKYTIELSNESKVLFPVAGITKGDLIEYYEKASELILPHTRDRLISMQRFPDGIEKNGFYHKALPDHFPDWIDSSTVKTKDGSSRQVVINKQATLVYLANFGCITPHIWLSRIDKIEKSDRLVFDLDPPKGGFDAVRSTALKLKELFDDIGVACFAQLTGSSGMHVVVPLRRNDSFDDVRETARRIAQVLVDRYPDQLTLEQYKDKRKGRLFLDTNRNAYGQTMATPYSIRAKAGAPVVTPVEWEEVSSSKLTSQSYAMGTIFKRMARREDPWADMAKHAVALSTVRAKLEKVESSNEP